jgi:hypothetical protein
MRRGQSVSSEVVEGRHQARLRAQHRERSAPVGPSCGIKRSDYLTRASLQTTHSAANPRVPIRVGPVLYPRLAC